jgi:hypothetical protein
VSEATCELTQQCILRFLGYCCYELRVTAGLTLALYRETGHFERFLNWLLETRRVKPQTLVQQVSAAIHVAKFLHRDVARPNGLYKDVNAVEVLRQLRRQLEGLIRFEPPSHEALAAMQRWLPWEQIVRTMRDLRALYESLPRPSAARSHALMRFLMVAFYIYFPPVRARPIRELRLGESLCYDASMSRFWVELRKVRAWGSTARTYTKHRLVRMRAV